MTLTQKLAAFAVATLGIFATANAANAQTAYAIANGGFSLISFNVANPSAASVVATFNGANNALDMIDFRPLNGQLYGYNDAASSFYTVNIATGALSLVASSAGTDGATASPVGGLDFNPTIDRARVVTIAEDPGIPGGQNRVYNPNASTPASRQTGLIYNAGDSGANGTGASIVENAYSNNLGNATTTTQYGIDNARGTLVTIANNDGNLATIGTLGLGTPNGLNPAFGGFAGFDIFTTLTGVNTAYAIIGADGAEGIGSNFYTINLQTGLASPAVGTFNTSLGTVYSLAVAPTVVPEANTGVMVGLAGLLGMVGAGVRRRIAAK